MLFLCFFSEPTTPATPTNVLNGCKIKPKLEDGPALAAVSGKRERRKKKFWDDEVDTLTSVPSSMSSASKLSSPASTSSSSSSALKRKTSVSTPVSRKSTKKSEKNTAAGDSNHTKTEDIVKSNGSANHHTNEVSEISDNTSSSSTSKQQPSGKENGKLLPYLQFDLNDDPELIAEKMIEGTNIPGMGQPIPVDSSSLPEGWEKRVIQRRIGITKGKWDVFITNPETGKSFRSKTELQKHLDERKLPYTSDAFDFSLDDNLKKLRQIWKQYKVKPFLNNPKGTLNSNFRHVPAKITQVQDSDIVGSGRGSSHSLVSSNATSSVTASSTAATVSVSVVSSSSSSVPSAVSPALANNLKQNISPPFLPNEMSIDDKLACLAEIAVESETGQGLRCSINKCGKLFRNNRLLRQHVKHYHPKIYDTVVCKHPGFGDDISEPTSPEAARRWSDNGEPVQQPDNQNNFHSQQQLQQQLPPQHFQQHHQERRRKPSSESKRLLSDENFSSSADHSHHHHHHPPPPPMPPSSQSKTFKKRPFKRSTLDEEAPLSSIYDDDEIYFSSKRTRNDSVPSSVNSDTEDISVSGEHPHSFLPQQQHPRGSGGPPTPPTFRLSKRRQAQMRRRVPQPVLRMSKIEDTPLGRDFREELLNLTSNSSNAVSIGSPGMSTATSPNGSVQELGGSNQPQSYPPSEMDASVAGSEHLTYEELVNCSCRRLEEDGLMIQCDICLCWQHGYCVGIEDEDPVPEKHVCETCRQPPGGRSEARFAIDQDWLKEGKLPSIENMFSRRRATSSSAAALGTSVKETAFRKLSELMADLSHLDKVLHGLRVKLHVASQPNNNKVFMWSSIWSLPTVVQSVEEEQEQPHDVQKEVIEGSCEAISSTTTVPNNTMLLEANKDQANGQAVDPQAVADKLNLIKEDTDNKLTNGPSICAKDDHETSQNVAEEQHTYRIKTDEIKENKKDHTTAEVSTEKENEGAKDHKTDDDGDAVPLTNGNNDVDEKEDESSSTPPTTSQDGNDDTETLLDASMIPSLSEVERLLPSVLQAMDDGGIDGNTKQNSSSSSSLPKASTSKAAVIIPEPKRLNRDECRLNLLQHIQSVQSEIEKRFVAIEEAIGKIETMPGGFHAGMTPLQLQNGESRIKSRLTMLIQDLAIARQLMWTL